MFRRSIFAFKTGSGLSIIFITLLLSVLSITTIASADPWPTLNCDDTLQVVDFIIYAAYFLYGPSVFTINLECQVASSDINNDGRILTVEDIIYLFYLISGEEPGGNPPTDTAVFINDLDYNTISVQYPDTLLVVFLGFPESAIASLSSGLDHMRLVQEAIYSVEYDKATGIKGTFLTYNSGAQLSDTPYAIDFNGNNVHTRIVSLSDGICGDANGDFELNISDAVFIINYVFASGPEPVPYRLGDCNCDAECNVSDAVWIINYVFTGGNDPCDTDGDTIPDC
jgi:hypothetical protein